MKRPSPNAKFMPIGREYRPTRFEHRRSDGTYQALMPRMSSHDERVQSALISRPRAYALMAFVLGIAVASACFLITRGG